MRAEIYAFSPRTLLTLLAFALTLAALGVSSNARADTYTWVDANGVVNYSERKPRGVPESRIRVVKSRGPGMPSTPTPAFEYEVQGGSAAQGSDGAAQADLSEDQQAMLNELEAAETARKAQLAKIRQDNCERSRRVLNNLSSLGRIRVTGEDGEPRVMPEDERSRRIEEAQRGIAENCTS